MASLLTHLAVGGVLGAAGAVAGGVILVMLRTFVVQNRRARQMAKIRQIGIVAVAKQALFDERNPELPFADQSRRASL
jgi:hypothetical protein